jgi:hypothetical protein
MTFPKSTNSSYIFSIFISGIVILDKKSILNLAPPFISIGTEVFALPNFIFFPFV